ncbi:DNA recombination protein RmuC [Bacilliculturomica massiliensis]|uniref:DNA recombination protein RmuC n=1 Tax=Bacilliculturomica massiliensis TaxID=1917867 RepID=UPI001FE3865A|nr:DNA recombination protein RmuC [Bacilliculturomica massiliensis]
MELYLVMTLVIFFGTAVLIMLSGMKKQLERKNDNSELLEQLDRVRQEMIGEIRAARQETTQYVQTSFQSLGELLTSSQNQASQMQDRRIAELTAQLSQRTEILQRTVNAMLAQMDERLQSGAIQSEQKLEQIRTSVETQLVRMQEDNGRKLSEMRATVDEKLQKTLEDRISQSFRVVSERLEQVYKGLGEMQTLASGVGDLKKVLSNVKTRGILGEIQLSAILTQILSPDQYEENINTKRSGGERVEFAVRLPGDGEGTVYLPIDAKFPGDTYARLADAYDSGDAAEIEEAGKALERAIRREAKDIRDKYVEPPYTTDFAIMFLPFEGLYAEVVRRGLVESLQRDYKINIAGPTTMAALLNSLQMGFRTLAIQKYSGEVWNVLGAVKTEFEKFGSVLASTQKKLSQANDDLDRLVGTRTRMIRSRLKNVTGLPEADSREVLGLPGEGSGEEGAAGSCEPEQIP